MLSRAWCLLALLPGLALAEPPFPVSTWDQYTRTPIPAEMYSATVTSTTVAHLIEDSASRPILLEWGSQVQVDCWGAPGEIALLIPALASSPTLTVGLGADLDLGAGALYADQSLGDSGVAGQVRGFVVPSGGWDQWLIAKGTLRGNVFGRSSNRQTFNSCTTVGAGYRVGAPCYDAADCGASGVCSATRDADGGHLYMLATSADLKCILQVGR